MRALALEAEIMEVRAADDFEQALEAARTRQTAAYAVFDGKSRRRRAAAKLLTRDEARRIAANIAKLPDLLGR